MAGLLDNPPQIDSGLLAQPAFPLPQGWGPQREGEFQMGLLADPNARAWVDNMRRLSGGQMPNMNDPSYNYRQAWTSGVRPEMYEHDGQPHWPSSTPDGQPLKNPGHPTAWMEPFMQRYTDQNGEGVDPHQASAGQIADAIRSGIYPVGDRVMLNQLRLGFGGR